MKVSVRRYADKDKPHLKWVVNVRADGKRIRRFFETKPQADAWANTKLIEATNIGNRAASITDELKLEAYDAAERLKPYGKTITEAVDYLIAYLDATSMSVPIEQAAEEFLQSMAKAGKSKKYLYDLKHRLKP